MAGSSGGGGVIPDYFFDIIKGVQRRAFRIIHPEAESYTEALHLANISSLKKKR